MLVVLDGGWRAASSSFGSCSSLPLLLPHDLFTFRNSSQSGIPFISESLRVSDRKEANIAAWRVVSSPPNIAAAFFVLRSSPARTLFCSALDEPSQLLDICNFGSSIHPRRSRAPPECQLSRISYPVGDGCRNQTKVSQTMFK